MLYSQCNTVTNTEADKYDSNCILSRKLYYHEIIVLCQLFTYDRLKIDRLECEKRELVHELQALKQNAGGMDDMVSEDFFRVETKHLLAFMN